MQIDTFLTLGKFEANIDRVAANASFLFPASK